MAASRTDAAVVGGGPNGLAAAIVLARAGRSVAVYEARDTVGGGCRSAELTLPGVVHDVCSAVHPLGRASPLFRELRLERHGLEWIEPPIQVAHPLDDGSAALVYRDVAATTESFDNATDARLYRRWVTPLAHDWELIVESVVGPIRPAAVLRHPFALARFGLPALVPAATLAARFRSPVARALLAGVGAHSFLPLTAVLSGGLGLALLVSAHAVGWPIPRGGSQRIADALASVLEELGGSITTGAVVDDLEALPPHRATMLDLTPRQILAVAGERLGGRYAGQLRRYRYGPAAFKLDIVLDGPIPWRNPALAEAGTVHLAGKLEEVVASEEAVRRGRVEERPFVLLAQPSAFDPSRAPDGRHVVWAYCHVPNGWPGDATEPILRQIERFAPGFRDRVLATHVLRPADLEAYNANYVGGDINGGLQHWAQFFTRPALRLDPYSTPDPRIFVCSSSTPPGGGVHGLCGLYAARSALRGPLR
ncbi:MAG TPA: NAD(P)/FAD-dependent oxidoreductase [Candidatus Limnocylindria bacterium]|nr:NAD(P)/FAD-dependent oxidoreductase [Candidatus Limnocylindria bacterium]